MQGPQSARMMRDPVLQEFWQFATEVRKTRSLAVVAARQVRGAWLTQDLVIQRVHGWGSHAVRLLCVAAAAEDRRDRLKRFFRADCQNMEARLVGARDPLDDEPRILVKIPYNASLQALVDREMLVLAELQGIPGIPVLERPVLFEDIEVVASAYRFCTAPSLQQQLDVGQLVPLEGIYQLWSTMLSVLAKVHDRGWLHADLQAKDVLLPESLPPRPFSRSSATPSPSPTPSSEVAAEPRASVGSSVCLCGWSRAVRRDAGPTGGGDLRHLLAQLVAGSLPQAPSMVASSKVGDFANARDAGDAGHEASPLSVYSAPEQYFTTYAGMQCCTPSTDIYRAAAIVLMASRGRSAFGNSRHIVEPVAVGCMDAMRQLCQDSILRRAGATYGACGTPSMGGTQDNMCCILPRGEAEAFAVSLQKLLALPFDDSLCSVCDELAPLLRQCLERQPGKRPQVVADVLEALDVAWSVLEQRFLRDQRNSRLSQGTPEVADSVSDSSSMRRNRFKVEPPPELENMNVL